MTGCAPSKPSQDHDPSHDVEDCGQQGVDHLQLHKREWKFDLDDVFNLKKIEEGPDEGDNEGGDNDEEEEVVVSEPEVFSVLHD